MWYYIFKEKLLVFKDLSKNYWHIYIILPFAISIVYNSRYSLLSSILSIRSFMPGLYLSMALSLFVCILGFFNFFKLLPPIRIDHPVLFAIFNTPKIHKELVTKYVRMAIIDTIVAMIINGFRYIEFGHFNIIYLLTYAFILLVFDCTKWIQYNKHISSLYAFLLLVICSVLAIFQPFVFIAVAAIILIIEFIVFSKMHIDWEKYFYDMMLKYNAEIGSVKKDMGRMAALGVLLKSRNTPNHFINLYDFNVNGFRTIVLKSVVSILRMEKPQMVLFSIVYIGGIVAFKLTNLIAIYYIITAMSLSMLENLFEIPFVQIVSKIDSGLNLPYTIINIFKGHIILFGSFLIIFVIPISLVSGLHLFGICISILALIVIMLGMYSSTLLKKVNNAFLRTLGFILVITLLNVIHFVFK